MKKLQGKNTESEEMLIGLIFLCSTCPLYLLQENLVISLDGSLHLKSIFSLHVSFSSSLSKD